MSRQTRRQYLRNATRTTGAIALVTGATSVAAASLKDLTIEGGDGGAEYEISVNTHGQTAYEGSDVENWQSNGETGLSEGVYNEKSGEDFALITGHVDRWGVDTYRVPTDSELYKVRIDGTAYVDIQGPYDDTKYGSLVIDGNAEPSGGWYTIEYSTSVKAQPCGDSVTGTGELEENDYAGYGYVDGDMDGIENRHYYDESDSDCYEIQGSLTSVSLSTPSDGGYIRSRYSAAQ